MSGAGGEEGVREQKDFMEKGFCLRFFLITPPSLTGLGWKYAVTTTAVVAGALVKCLKISPLCCSVVGKTDLIKKIKLRKRTRKTY